MPRKCSLIDQFNTSSPGWLCNSINKKTKQSKTVKELIENNLNLFNLFGKIHLILTNPFGKIHLNFCWFIGFHNCFDVLGMSCNSFVLFLCFYAILFTMFNLGPTLGMTLLVFLSSPQYQLPFLCFYHCILIAIHYCMWYGIKLWNWIDKSFRWLTPSTCIRVW